MADRKISLITMGQGNVKALQKTIESFKDIVDEIVYGDLLIFNEDRLVIREYEKEYNFRSIRLPFNYIFQMGFSSVLNYLISNAKNDLCIYMNTSEAIQVDNGINEIVNNNPECNTFYFDHATDKHRWFRMNDRRELSWQGYIHEECNGNERPYHKPIFRMMDYEKDMDNPFKASVFNSVKELCYFEQYIRIVDYPHLLKGTNEGWLKFAKENYKSMKERLELKGNQLTAFRIGDFDMFLEDIFSSDYFEKTRFESTEGMNFQGARHDIL